MAKFNTELAIAEMEALSIVVMHNLRYARRFRDKEVVNVYHQTLAHLVKFSSWSGYEIAKREKELHGLKK